MGAPEPAAEAATEAALLASLARGERAAAEALVDATYRRVFVLLRHLAGGDRDLAADLTQETYRRAWVALPSFDRRAVLALPDALRSTVILRYWADESPSEIAREEGLSVVAIRKRLRRAIALLTRMLKEESS
jgi:DNA-directed RNA polymerase specialized sigma24 family protein